MPRDTGRSDPRGVAADRRARRGPPGRAASGRAASQGPSPADTTVRAFLAVFPPPEVEERLSSYVESLRAELRELSWTKAGNLHLTLRFLGDIDTAQVEAAGRAADEAVQGKRAFKVRFGMGGAFPSLNRPRVAWLGVEEGAPELIALAADLDQALARGGLGRADRPFASHLTLGRVRDYLPPGALPALFQKCPAPALEFEARSLDLIQSRLDPKGSIYTPLHQAALGSPGSGRS